LYSCPLCESKSSTKLYAEAEYDENNLDAYAFASRKTPEYQHHELIECKECQFLFCVNIPSQEMLHLLYKDAAFDSKSEAQNASVTYMKYLKKKSKTPINRNMALDIGTGEGSFLEILLSEEWKDVAGVEPSKSPIELADEKVKPLIINNIFKTDDFENDSYDLVSIFQTIEHIPNPLAVATGIRELLISSGIVYIVCHNYLSPVNKLLGKKSPIFDIEHLQLFSKKSIRVLLTKAGFTDIKIFTLVNSYPLYYWVKLFPLSANIKKSVLRFLDITGFGRIKVGINVGNIGVIAK